MPSFGYSPLPYCPTAHCLAVPVPCCLTIPRPHCQNAALHPYFTAPLSHCPTESPHCLTAPSRCSPASISHCLAVSLTLRRLRPRTGRRGGIWRSPRIWGIRLATKWDKTHKRSSRGRARSACHRALREFRFFFSNFLIKLTSFS